MDPDRFDDVGYEIVEIPDVRRRRISRRGAVAVVASVVAVAAVSAGAALALTPASSPSPAARSAGAPPMHFAAETYPARGQRVPALHGGNCLHLHRRAGTAAPKL